MNRTHYYIYISALLLLLGAALPLHAQTIKGTIYGGGQIAQVDGNTQVDIKTGDIHKDVFGGGMGKLNDEDKTIVEASADVTGSTKVNIDGGKFGFPTNGIDPDVNHNVYGGGNFACKIGTIGSDGNLVAETGNTTVNIKIGLLEAGFMDGNASSAWGKWETAVNAKDDNVAQGSVFGGGYGVNTVVMGTAKVVVNVAEDATRTAMVDVVGGGYNGFVLSNTDVTVEGVPEIYKIYGGGLGSRGGYDDAPTDKRSHANLTAYSMQETIGSVGEGKNGDGTSVTIHGGKFYNDIFGGGAGLKYKDGERYLNVAEVFGTTSVEVDAPSWIDGDKFSKNIYGGGALGLVADAISVTLKSGEFDGAQVFGGSLGEDRHADDKAKVTGNTHVLVTHNDATPTPNLLKGCLDIYGGCDMAQVDGNTSVTVEYGTFNGCIFGGGLGRSTEYLGDNAEANKDYGKVTGNTSVIIDGGANWESLTLGAPAKYTATEATEANTTNGITEGQPGYVREGDYKKPIKVYGGSALGLIGGTLDVKLKSGTLYGEMFGGSLGELGYVEKAKVTTVATISTEVGSVDSGTGKPYPLNGLFNIYGGCDMAQIENNTHVNLQHGTFSGNIFGGGKGVNELSTTAAGAELYLDYGKVIGETSIVLDAPEIVLGEDDERDSDGNITEEKPKIGIYGGGALGMVDGKINPVTLKSGTLYGSIFGGSLGEKGHLAKALVTGNTAVKTIASETNFLADGTTPAILQGNFHIYGGCDMAQVKGNTSVTIQHGTFTGEIYGGGKGLDTEGSEAYMYYGRVFGTTNVLYENDNDVTGQGTFNGDIYGGGALGLVSDPLDADKPDGWTKPDYITEVHLKKGDLNGQVYGGGRGEKVNVDKAKVTGNTLVKTDASTGTLGGDINHVYGGGNMAQVDGNTRVEITHGSFSGTIFGGGNGIYEDDGTPAGSEKYINFGKVTGETYVLIDGPDLKLGKASYFTAKEAEDYNKANDLHGADPSDPGSKADPNFKTEGDWKEIQSTMSIYGGGALGMVGKSITVEVKSGEIYGSVFAGSKGEEGHVAKALVTTEGDKKVTVKTVGSDKNFLADGTTPADLNGDFKIYGGCDLAMFEGTSEVVINHGTFSGEIYGGGNGLSSAKDKGETRYGQVTGTSKVIIDSDGRFNGDIYGGGALGLVVPKKDASNNYILPATADDPITTVYLFNGEVNGNVFGGSLGEKISQPKAMITGNTLVTTAIPSDYTPAFSTGIEGRIENFFGGGNMASVDGNTKVHVNRGHFNGRIFGGGNGVPSEGTEEYLEFGKVTGSSNVLIDGEETLQIGESATYTPDEANTHNTALSATPGDVNYVQEGDYKKPMKIYGGGALGKVGGTINIAIKNGNHYGEVFGGSLGEKGHPNKALVTGNTNAWAVANKLVDDDPTKPANDALPLTGDLKFYGGCEMARVEGQSKVTINHGSFSGAIYGGGKGIQEVSGTTEGNEQYLEYGKVVGVAAVGADANDPIIASVVDFNNANGTFTGNIYGGGALGMIESGIANVQMKAGTVNGNVYGGSYGENTLPAKGTAAATLVEMLGGSVNAVADTELKGEVYGGGALANIAGNTEVYLYGGTVGGNVFGGGLGNAETYQKVGGDTKVILGTADYATASVIDGGSIFGANNINGTPRGCSFVHVRRTVPRSTNSVGERNVADDEDTDSYDVFAVYGGGNLSAYQPSDATYALGKGFATVLIENCDNSIAYVYGGGNAAPVPGTDVKIYGADAINHAFAGGNGKGVGNDGADVGFLGFYSVKKDEAEEYGSGKASIAVYGGTVHNVYGGSNTLGYIRDEASVNVADPEDDDPYDHGCTLAVGKTFGGGNQADIVGNIEMCLDCTTGADIVFAGANNANVYGNIHLTVQSGTFRQVFCSNNKGGAVFGKLQLDVDETGCTPVIIKELFGGGNLAPYSVYGYNDDGTCKTSGDRLYADPVVNIYSCTAIGTVYGGGFGNTAMVYGNPTVNVDMVRGAFAGRTIESNSDGFDKNVMVIKEGSIHTAEQITINDTIGTIGNIFGGGKEADVYGNTTVNVCVKDADPKLTNRNDNSEAVTSAFISAFEDDSPIMSYSDADKAANDVPTGSIYGGGKMANVHGNTRVHIRNGNIEGNVFGAGQGDAAQPDAALVKGKTEVIIGEE